VEKHVSVWSQNSFQMCSLQFCILSLVLIIILQKQVYHYIANQQHWY